MDSFSATSNIAKKAPRNLNRAKACSHCRRRKTKCDAKRPHCSQCLARRKPGIEIVCEYPIVGRTRKRTLEESISTLEKRIRELERAEPDEDAVKLYDPSIYPLPSISSPLTHSKSPTSSTSLLLDASIPESSLYTAIEYQEDIPIALGQRLLSAFVPHARTFGFFLNLSRFLSSMTLPPAPGDSSRPCRGLMCSVYLLGLHFTGASADEESVFLSKTLWHVSNVLSADHPLRLIHGAQAEILLCNYFFRTGRIVEGKYHLSSAVNLCACAGLNKVRSGNMDTVFSASSLMGIGGSVLPEPQDLVDEGERINAFWTAFTLCNIWGVWVGGGISMIFESLGFQIDTPWPLDMEDYEESRIPPNYTGALTVRKFLSETPPSQHALSKTAWFAQSSLLLERAANMANSYRNELHPDDHARYMNAFTSLDRLIDSFHASLPHFSQTPLLPPILSSYG
ncbi:hypothetical protein D9757_005734 [Collybiopsis confluens]|uniref:Zn(2)-C6 fungal-type domain-containing protein n=1 Tax=Collybiopsis confluens TaxID=2823264 RepID=A0A8H5HQE6_9AGAR|nr:hypothetical protein D9757_005734 [Collybiopsis confluens]